MLRLIVFALAARGAAAANAEITTGAALEDAIGGERPVLALFCSKTAHMCAEHLLGAFDELVLRRDDVALASLSGPAEPELTKALAVAGFGMMNVMLLSVSVWSGNATGITPETRDFFHWLSALIALPAIGFAGRPFFKSAWGAVKRGTTNMDVPISLGVIIAAALSLYETWVGGAHGIKEYGRLSQE